MTLVFGPVPSRRLGRSLGINNVPAKGCSYSCAYCQVGATVVREIERREFFPPETVTGSVHERVGVLRERNQRIDYLTFVPEGEPTLDRNLGRCMAGLAALEVPVAVLTNGSLLWRADVRHELEQADCVSIKVDAVTPDPWKVVNRPHRALSLDRILDGISAFAARYSGKLLTETMLVRGANDRLESLIAVADFVASLKPAVAYVAVPTRPPASSWVAPPPAETVNRAVQLLGARVPRVEYLIGCEGPEFGTTGDPVDDLLSITAVHPMREDAVRRLLDEAGADDTVVDRLVEEGRLIRTQYAGTRFYMRRISTAV